jgi:hypothetical protein
MQAPANCQAPCLSTPDLIKLQSLPNGGKNASMWAPATDACGGDPPTILQTVCHPKRQYTCPCGYPAVQATTPR